MSARGELPATPARPRASSAPRRQRPGLVRRHRDTMRTLASSASASARDDPVERRVVRAPGSARARARASSTRPASLQHAARATAAGPPAARAVALVQLDRACAAAPRRPRRRRSATAPARPARTARRARARRRRARRPARSSAAPRRPSASDAAARPAAASVSRADARSSGTSSASGSARIASR